MDDFLRLADALPTEIHGKVGRDELRAVYAPAFMALEGVLQAGTGPFHRTDESRLAAVFARMRSVCESLGLPHWRARLDYSAARIWQARGRYDLAEAILVDFREAYPDEYSAHTHRETLLAQLAWRSGDAELALSVLNDARRHLAQWDPQKVKLTEEQRANLFAAVARIHGIRGTIYSENGLIEAADEEFEREWRAAQACGFADSKLNSLLRRGRFATILGRPRRTIDDIDRFLLEHGDALDDERRARLLLCKGQAEEAAEFADPGRERRAATTLESALSTRRLSHSDQRVAHLQLFGLAVSAASRDQGEARATALRTAAARAREWEELDAESRATAGGNDDLAAIFSAFEADLALLREDPLEDLRKQLDRHKASYRQLLGQWQSFNLRRGGIGFLRRDDRRSVLGSLIDLHVRIAEEEGRKDGPVLALEPVLAAHELTTLARQRGAGPCSLAEVRANLLDHGNGALVYVPTNYCTHLFVVDAETVAHYELDGRLDVLKPIRRLLVLLHDNPAAHRNAAAAAELEDASRSVYDVLLPRDVENRIRSWTGVTVLGADALADLPFEAIVLNDGSLLGEAVPVDSLPSFALGGALAREANLGSRHGALRIAFVGTLIPSGGTLGTRDTSPTPFPRGITDAILECYDEDGRMALLDEAATRTAFLDLDLRNRDVVHVVAHGLQRADVELGRGLALSDAPVWHDDLRDELASAPRGLVVISACSSGRGESRIGEGGHLTDLAGAFLWRGARVVALSQVDILAGRHLRLMQHFHRGLARQGLSPAAAMQRARLALAAEDNGAARFYFAQMQVAGLGQRPLAAK